MLAQYLPLSIAAGLLVVSVVLHLKQHYRWALLLLTFGAGAFYVAAALLCPFLNLWDEQYHAVVAMNCMNHPFAPAFYTEQIVPGHDYSVWTSSGIWLHKQPLFLWQIALSYKLFGVSLFSLRLPSIIMCTLLVPMAYRIAKLLLGQHRIAFLSAVAAACSWHLFRLTAGLECTDHNDVCFVFYVTASLWALTEYRRCDGSWRWALAIGLFAGAAVLTKWLTGLFVYLIWGVAVLCKYKWSVRNWKIPHVLLALCVTMLLVVPWQIYIFRAFPEPAHQEMALNASHFNEVVENHEHQTSYYFDILPMQYVGHGFNNHVSRAQWNLSTLITLLLLLVGAGLLLKYLPDRSTRWAVGVSIAFVYLFFTLAKTKMPSFTFFVCVFWFMAIACSVDAILNGLMCFVRNQSLKNVLTFAIIVFVAMYQTNYQNCKQLLHWDFDAVAKSNRTIYESWRNQVPENALIFNVNGYTGSNPSYSYLLSPSAMFFSGRTCYTELPPYQVLKDLQSKGVIVAIVDMPLFIDSNYIADTTFVHLLDNVRSY